MIAFFLKISSYVAKKEKNEENRAKPIYDDETIEQISFKRIKSWIPSMWKL